jgi:glucosamine--fructose-6-phosphate aminotransferase (isomerizing)
MCGIIGYIGSKECVNFIVSGLKLLEYRGYDSAGVASYSGSSYKIVKAQGKITNIEKTLHQSPLAGTVGIGHTRWATHGKPNDVNAHPHRAGKTVLVHNGIIENYEEIRNELRDKGYKIISETDSELFGHLVEDQMKSGTEFVEAVRLSFLRLRGSCTIVTVHDDHPNVLVAIRNGTPLVAAYAQGSGGAFVASDAQGLIAHTQDITYLENLDMVVASKEGFKVYSVDLPVAKQTPLRRNPTHLDWTLGSMEKEGFDHYMLKEIHEQPRALLDTLDSMIDRDTGVPHMNALQEVLPKIRSIHMVACGTAWHAAMVGRYILESVARLPVIVDLASEYRYRDPVAGPDTLVIAVTQSGETADTLAALREAKALGAYTAAICNVRGSSITRDAHMTFYTAAGPEIGVASTKAFTTQILMMMLLGQWIAHAKNLEPGVSPFRDKLKKPFDISFFLKLPHAVQSALLLDDQIKKIAQSSLSSRGFLYVGRGMMYPIALEGALKMKEISYCHAEGYAAGELKHGPIAMVDESMSIVVLAPRDALYEKNISNLQEVKARGGRIIAIGNKNDAQLQRLADHLIGLDFGGDWIDTVIATVPLQLLSYHAAVLRGNDVDKPRNLAKSVTVE